MRIDFGDLAFNSYEPDSDGCEWYVTGLEGWDSPATRQGAVEPTTRHGQVMAKGLLAARAMTFAGIVKAPTLATHYESKERLQAAANNLYAPRPFLVTEDAQRAVSVVRAGRLRMAQAGIRAFTFELPLICPDPLKYAVTGTTVTFTAGQTRTISNPGNFISEKWEVTATSDGTVVLTNTTVSGALRTTDGGVESGTVFNALDRTIYSPDDRPLYSSLAPNSSWWGLQPGDNSVTNDGTAALSYTYYPAWL